VSQHSHIVDNPEACRLSPFTGPAFEINILLGHSLEATVPLRRGTIPRGHTSRRPPAFNFCSAPRSSPRRTLV
jgi:hypothetical protein